MDPLPQMSHMFNPQQQGQKDSDGVDRFEAEEKTKDYDNF